MKKLIYPIAVFLLTMLFNLPPQCLKGQIYVDASKTGGSNNGTSWANAYTSLQSALNVAVAGNQIWVAKGTYRPSSTYGLLNTPRYYHFQMIKGVAIYGGFAGTETDINQRTNFGVGEANETILSGDLNGDDVVTGSGSTLSITGNDENCYRVFYHPETLGLTDATLDGFTISGGNAVGSESLSGGGMYNVSASLTLRNLSIISNSAKNYGGGLHNTGSSTITLTNSTISLNKAESGGGGIYNRTSILNCENVTITGNNSTAGAGIIIEYYSNVKINNAIIASNTATNFGGGVYTEDSEVIMNNTTIANNSTTVSDGGGIYSGSSLKPVTLNNCIIWNNKCGQEGNQLYRYYGDLTLNYCCYSNGPNDIISQPSPPTTSNCINLNPMFVNAAGGDHRLYGNSPCVNNGDNSANTTSTDIRGQARKQQTTIDIGAYEWTTGIDPEEGFVNPTSGGSIESDRSVCSGQEAGFLTNITYPSGNIGILEYKWQSSTTSGTDGFTDIPNSNYATGHELGIITISTWYKRLARVRSATDWSGAAESNVIKITVDELPAPPTAGSNTFTYDGNPKRAEVITANNEAVNWYDAETEGNTVARPSGFNAGTYSAWAEVYNNTTGCVNPNRKLITLTINKLVLNVTADSKTKRINDPDPELTYTYSPELLPGNHLTGALTREEGESAGSYPILVGTLSAGDNYSIAFTSNYLSIISAPITEPGNALHFDGVDDYVAIPSVATNMETFTIEAWINPTTIAASGNIAIISSKTWNYVDGGSVHFQFENGIIVLSVNGLAINGWPRMKTKLATNVWQHIAVTYSKKDEQINFYLNGQLNNTINATLPLAKIDEATIGAWQNQRYFNGKIDEIRIWNVARTEDEISANIYNTVSPNSEGLLSYYNFNEGIAGTDNTSRVLPDQTSNKNDGTLQGFNLKQGAVSNWVESYAMVIPATKEASNITTTGFTVNWAHPTNGIVENYKLYVSKNASFTELINGYSPLTLEATATSAEVTGLDIATTYYYSVKAEKGSVIGEGAFSNPGTTTTLEVPTITWNNPDDITYGTALSSLQLNASCNVDGSIIYDPAEGTVLNVGNNQVLNATFTPSNPEKYTTASASVTINVLSSTGINNPCKNQDIKLYPNPCTNGFTISADEKTTILTMYDLLGRLVAHHKIQGKSYVDTSKLPAGTYIVKVNEKRTKLVIN